MILCPYLKNPDVARDFKELKQATSEKAAYRIWSLNGGHGIDKAPNGAKSKLFLSLLEYYNGDRTKAIQAKAKTYGTSFLNWFGDWTLENKEIDDETRLQISLIFRRIPELAKIGTQEQYALYIQTIFPNSVDKSIYWHGSNSDFSQGFESAIRAEGSGAPETKERNDFYLAKQAWSVLQYVNGVNRKSIDKNGFSHWNKLWWEFKEIMSNGRRENNDWKDLVINEKTVRLAIPNKKGVFNRDKGGNNGKWLKERKADYGYENKSDKEFFEEILGVKWGVDTFNTWTQRNAEIFKSLLYTQKGIYPAVINTINPIRERGLNTYYEEDRGLFSKADREGNDAILGEATDNEFGSDVAVVLRDNNNVHFLGTEKDINAFSDFVKKSSVSKVVDENGEPKIVYHGSKTSVTTFDSSKSDARNELSETIKPTNFFSDDRTVADAFAKTEKQRIANAIAASLNEVAEAQVEDENEVWNHVANSVNKSVDWVKNFWLNELSFEERMDASDGIMYDPDVENQKYQVFLNLRNPIIIDGKGLRADKVLEENKEVINNSDEVIIININETVGKQETATDYLVRKSNQIKSAVANQGPTPYEGTYSTDDNDIYHSLPVRTNLREDVIKMLKDRHLIQNWRGLRTIKGESGDTIRERILNAIKGLPVAVTFNQSPNSTSVKIIENITISEAGLDEIARSNDKNLKEIMSIISFLQERFPNMRIVKVDNEHPFPKGTHPNANAIVKGGVIYINFNKINTEQTIEEFLHPLVYTIQYDNLPLFQSLFYEALKLFPKLWAEIQNTYTDKEGFDKSTRENEIVTQALSRYVRIEKNSKNRTRSFVELAKKFFNYIGVCIQTAIEKINGTYIVDPEKLPKMKLSELAKLVTLDNVLFKTWTTDLIMHSISTKQRAYEETADKMIQHMLKLYQTYDRIPNKSIQRQRLAGRIYEKYNEMKQFRENKTVELGIDFAIENLGIYEESYGGPNPQLNTVFSYLVELKKIGFSGISAQRLVEIYRFSIKFYDRMLNDISVSKIDLSEEDRQKLIQIKATINDFIKPLWVEAMMKVGDDLVDENIDKEVVASDLDKEQMKEVAKDWLHKNLMYGDLNAAESYLYNHSYSRNPIIKQIFHMIQHAEQKTQEEMLPIGAKIIAAYQNATTKERKLSGNWQTIFMEYDEDGIPTGNFVREINYGQYEKDLINFRKHLNDEFIAKYGHTYIEDDTGLIINSVTLQLADEEEWGPNGEEPIYIKYLKEIEKFRCERANRRWTIDYYLERMSRPYDGEIDPQDANFNANEYNHGLSPRTLSRYRYFRSNINFYLNRCTDEDGNTHPEDLTKEDRQQLDYWQSQIDDLSNIFTVDGKKKSGDALKMAYEIRAWQKFLNDRTDYYSLQNLFDIEYQLAIQNNNLYNFIKYNASVAIHPDYIKQTIREFRKNPYVGPEAVKALLIDKSLRALVKDNFKLELDLYLMENNINFWLECKRVDDVLKDALRAYKQDPDYAKNMAENFDKYFVNEEIIYRDENGFAFDQNGNRVRKEDENITSLLTFRQHLIYKFSKEAFETGVIKGLYTTNGTLYNFNGKSYTEIRALVTKIFTYQQSEEQEDGSVKVYDKPLSIFTVLKPKQDTFFNTYTGRVEKTIWYQPKNRFSRKSTPFINTNFDFRSGIAELPKAFDRNGNKLYDNSEAFNKVVSDAKTKKLYDVLINTMKDSLKLYNTRNRTFNYRLPLIEARTAALLSRLITSGYRGTVLTGLWEQITTVQENDDDMRIAEDHYVGVDGEVANDVPLKFVHRLKHPENISTDIVSSVILFANMAHNYKNKSEIDNKIKALAYNMQEENRLIYNQKIKGANERSAKTDKYSVKTLLAMINKHMYGNNWEDSSPQEGGDSKSSVAWKKLNRSFLRLESTQMLGLNVFSMAVGFGDSLTRILSESAAGKYMTVGDVMFALGYCIIKTPQVLKNLGNPLANNKLTALMQNFGISKGVELTYSHTNWGTTRKVIYNLLMGGFSMLDWMANALLLVAFMHNSRLIEEIKDDNGNVIVPKGFYTKYELQQKFINAGLPVSLANAVHHNWSNYGKRVTLFDAYEFEPWEEIEDGEGGYKYEKAIGLVRVKNEYAQYVTDVIKTRVGTKTKKRGALYNGMNPDNDTPRWKQNFLGSLIGALRSWMIQQIQHLFAGGTDNVVREFEEVPNFVVEAGRTVNRPIYKKKDLSREDKLRRMSYDYETGTSQDQIIVCLWRSIKTLFNSIRMACMLKPQAVSFSRTEKYAFKDATISLAMLAAMMVAFSHIWGLLGDIPKPKNREEAGPATWWNPIDYYLFFVNQYIPNGYYKLGAADVLFRIIESKISNMNPKQAYDIVKSISALASGLEDQLGFITLVPDFFSDDEELSSIVKQGGYKYYTKAERVLYRAIGIVKNMHTFLTYYGMDANLRYYTNMYGKIFRMVGFDFSRKQNNENASETNSRRPVRERPSRERPVRERPVRERPTR